MNSYWDRGLLGMVLDPDFETNGNVYVSYTYDHILGDPAPAPRWPDLCPTPPGGTIDGCVVSARVSRFTLTNGIFGRRAGARRGLVQQFPSHSIGDLEFGDDGFLYASGGDGAVVFDADWGQFGGSAGQPDSGQPVRRSARRPRASRTPRRRAAAARSAASPAPAGRRADRLDGTIIRIDPDTGAAAPGNPLAGTRTRTRGGSSPTGFRNPFRIAFRPGHERALDRRRRLERHRGDQPADAPAIGPVENFGWPCYEGYVQNAGYAGLTQCHDLYADATAAIREPRFAYSTAARSSPGDGCPTLDSAVISGLAFYEGGSYPARFDDALFFADHSRNCIWAMGATNGVPDPAKVEVVVREAGNPVDLQAGPNGDIFYVDHEGGQIHRLTYAAGNTPPVAQISATPTSGDAPMDVEFDGRTSADSDPGDTLTYAWDFTDNGSVDATTSTASFEYDTPAVYTARLTVTDQHGASGTTTQQIVADGSGAGHRHAAGEPDLEGRRRDRLLRLGHRRRRRSAARIGAELDPDDPALRDGHELPSARRRDPRRRRLRHVRRTGPLVPVGAGDPAHRLDRRGRDDRHGRARPEGRDPRLPDDPEPARLLDQRATVHGVVGTPKVSRTFIVGSHIGLSTPSPQILDGVEYTFDRWSDGSTSRTRTISAPSSPWSPALSALFDPTSADLSLTQTGVLSPAGTKIAWKVVARNAEGGLRAHDVRVRVELPKKLAKPVFDAPGWSCRWRPGAPPGGLRPRFDRRG